MYSYELLNFLNLDDWKVVMGGWVDVEITLLDFTTQPIEDLGATTRHIPF